mmetsp:Transcript_141091/g.367249  ORF Transcript_141091/g.367249 Transcript_141091/m.367249 type:complete len:1799 (+) Transcript_141091:59-5455(+)
MVALRYIRAPGGAEDNLSVDHIDRYLSLLSTHDAERMRSPYFDVDAQKHFAAAGGERLEHGALRVAVHSAMQGMSALQKALQDEFQDEVVLSHAVSAFERIGHQSPGISCNTFPDFVRFCVAYRIHCYFETSLCSIQSSALHAPNQSDKRPEIVFVLGGPGAGKGTQCIRISATFGYTHLSAGDLLREERKRPGSQYGELIESYIREGKLVPVQITVSLIQEAMRRHGWTGGKYLVDGFPRSFDNLEGWREVLGAKVNIKFALFFDCSEACMEARLLERGKSSGRSDDNAESIRKRFRTFQSESMPVVEKLDAQGLLRRVSADRSAEEVWASVRALFGPTVVFVLGGPGAGKGTLCARIAETFGYRHLSAGDLLRAERSRPGSELGGVIESCIHQGKLVPAEIMVRLLLEAMQRHGWDGGKYLVDGFPRSFENLRAWQSAVGDRVGIKLCLYLECCEGVMEARLLERGKTSGRSDDNLESIRKRFVVFHTDSVPVVEHFKNEGLLKIVNAEQGAEDVWKDVQALFGPSVVFVLGGPGAGKGTQCARIVDAFGYKHLSAGDLLRAERLRAGSEFGELIQNYIKDGKLVPVEITIKLIVNAMEQCGWEGGRYLVDGFPRSADNLEGWNRVVGTKANVRFALFLDCGEATMEARLLERGKTSGRTDDNLESIRKRFTTFRQESLPVIDMFNKAGSLQRIDAEQTCEVVWEQVKKLFAPSVIFMLGGPGAGKGTQCSRISPSFGFQHLSAGDLLRDERKRPGSEIGELIEDCLRNGRLVSVDIVLRLLQQAMEKRGWEGGKYVIDGFPRSFDNMDGWKRTLGAKVNIRFAISLECSEAVMMQRLLNRGKISGRTDDNLDSIQKRFQTFQNESLPVMQSFMQEGLLRKINAEQNPDDVWSCIQELMHNELDRHPKNQAVVLLKPHARNRETERFIQSHLTMHNVAVLQKGNISSEALISRDLFRRQYRHIIRYSEADPASIRMSPQAQKRFKQFYGTDWADALAQCEVASASGGPSRLGVSKHELFELWSQSSVLKLMPSLQVAHLRGPSGSACFVVNGFVPHWCDTYAHGAEVLYFVVEFDPARLSWRQFRSEIVGATNPLKASPKSMRAQLHQHWRALGLPAAPDMLNNGVHASAGPLEGLRERMLWACAGLTDDALARVLLSSGIPRATLEAWLENPEVDGWPAEDRELSGSECGETEAGSRGPLFDCTANCDTLQFRQSALSYAREHAGGLQCWPMLAKERATLFAAAMMEQKQDSSSQQQQQQQPPKRMTIIHFNDVYNVEPRVKEPVGGLARFVTRIRELKQESVSRGEEEAVVLFSGDAFNPSLTSTTTMGKHMVPALNAIGIHTACYGNHDFDFGVDQLVTMASETNFPWLISNVTDKATGRPLAEGLQTRLMDFHGRKIGLIGLVEREWLVTLATLNPEDVEYEDFCPCARRLANHLKQQEGAEIVIALTHMRVPNDELLAHEVPEVDLILGGHDHHYDVKPVGPHSTYVLKSGTDFRDITVLQIEFTDAVGQRSVSVVDVAHVEVVASIPEDPKVKCFVDECVAKVGAAMDKIIGETAVDLDSRFASIRTRETNIGNFIADVMRKGLNADLAIINSGTLRADAIIEAGAFKMRDLVNLLPMLDELCLLQVTGTQVLAVLENAVSQYPRLEGRFAQVSGINFTFDAAKAPGQRVALASVQINGEPLSMSSKYKLCTKDYLRQGKDGYDVFKDAICLADGEQAGILPTMVREYFLQVTALNGDTNRAPVSTTCRATGALADTGLAKVGAGPEPLQRFAIEPQVEGRIICLNPVAA